MLRLYTLGTPDLQEEDGRRVDSVLAHAKRTALLAYLCASKPPRTVRRATLVALLWPEADEEHARGALRHELSQLRRSLGPGVLLGEGGESIGVDGERLWCDLWTFESALDAGSFQEALELWHGELLQGLQVPGGEFDRWLDEMRSRLARRVVEAGRRLSVEVEEAGDVAGAIAWARRVTELAPFDESGWQRLLLLLDRAGDRSGALKAFEALATRMGRELEAEPSPETLALVERIRERRQVLAAPVGRSGPPASPIHLTVDLESSESVVPGSDVRRSAAASAPVAGVASRTRAAIGRWLRLLALAAPTFAVLFLAFGTVEMPWASPSRAVVEFPRVENLTGNPALEPLRRLVEDELSEVLSTVEFLELVGPGNREEVSALVTGALYRRGDVVEARLRVEEARAGGKVKGLPPQVLPTATDPGPQLDSLAVSVLVALAVQYDPRFDAAGGEAPQLAVNLPLYESYLQYVQGSDLFGEQDYAGAAQHLLRSYEIDPGFGKAAVFGAIAMAWAGQPAEADSFATAILAENDFLSDFERAFGEWFLADLQGRRGDAYRAAREFEHAAAGSSPSAVAVAAYEAAKFNRPREALRKMEHVNTEHGWLRSFTLFWEAWVGAFHMVGDHGAELNKALEARARFPESLGVIGAEVRARAARGEPGEVDRLIGEAMTLSPDGTIAAELAWVGAQELDAHGQDSAAAAIRHRALGSLAQCEPLSSEAKLVRVRLHLESGDVEGAHEVLETLPPLRDLNWLALKGLVAASRRDTVAALEAIVSLEAMNNPYLSGRHLLHASGIRAALGEHELAVQTLRRALGAGLPFGVELHALPIFSPLAGRRDFEDLLRPRG